MFPSINLDMSLLQQIENPECASVFSGIPGALNDPGPADKSVKMSLTDQLPRIDNTTLFVL
jgi:hypothetical protein